MTATQSQAAERILRRQDLLARLRKETSFRTARVRRVVGDLLTEREAHELQTSALALGVLRALAMRFALENGLDHEWWVAARRRHGHGGRHRGHDVEILRAEYPAFADFVVEVSDDEVVANAIIEYRDSIAAPGTDFHYIGNLKRHVLEVAGVGPDEVVVNLIPIVSIDSLDAEDEGFIDARAQALVTDAELVQLLEDPEHPFGPLVTRVVEVAIQEFGVCGLFWIAERLFSNDGWTQAVRIMAGEATEVGSAEFERIRRDLLRKAPEIQRRMQIVLSSDPEALTLLEALGHYDEAMSPALIATPTNHPVED